MRGHYGRIDRQDSYSKYRRNTRASHSLSRQLGLCCWKRGRACFWALLGTRHRSILPPAKIEKKRLVSNVNWTRYKSDHQLTEHCTSGFLNLHILGSQHLMHLRSFGSQSHCSSPSITPSPHTLLARLILEQSCSVVITRFRHTS